MVTQEQIRRARAQGKGQDAVFQKTGNSTLINESALTFQMGGSPAAGAYLASIAGTQFIGDRSALSHAGLLTFAPAVDPEQLFLTFTRGLNGATNPQGIAYWVDLLVEYSAFNGNSGPAEQATGTATGDNDLPRYVDGENVQIYGDVITALGATPRGLTVRGTDQDGNTFSTVSVNTVASQAAIQGVAVGGPFLPLPSGVRGCKSIQGATLAVGGTGAGTFALLLVRKLASMRVELNSGLMEADFVNLQPMLPRLEEFACPAIIWCPGATNVPTLNLDLEALALDPDDPDA